MLTMSKDEIDLMSPPGPLKGDKTEPPCVYCAGTGLANNAGNPADVEPCPYCGDEAAHDAG